MVLSYGLFFSQMSADLNPADLRRNTISHQPSVYKSLRLFVPISCRTSKRSGDPALRDRTPFDHRSLGEGGLRRYAVTPLCRYAVHSFVPYAFHHPTHLPHPPRIKKYCFNSSAPMPLFHPFQRRENIPSQVSQPYSFRQGRNWAAYTSLS